MRNALPHWVTETKSPLRRIQYNTGWQCSLGILYGIFHLPSLRNVPKQFFTQTTRVVPFILPSALYKTVLWRAPALHIAPITPNGSGHSVWYSMGHLWLQRRLTASKAFSYPSGLTDGKRWILVSSTRWRIRGLPDRYSMHMNCIRRRSSSRPSTSLPWEPAV